MSLPLLRTYGFGPWKQTDPSPPNPSTTSLPPMTTNQPPPFFPASGKENVPRKLNSCWELSHGAINTHNRVQRKLPHHALSPSCCRFCYKASESQGHTSSFIVLLLLVFETFSSPRSGGKQSCTTNHPSSLITSWRVTLLKKNELLYGFSLFGLFCGAYG